MPADYDFHTLSPLDFEELARDLLQAEWDVRLESFGPGRDLGIDARFCRGDNNIVIQAKHYLRSGYQPLLRAAKAECAKVARLQPSRYVLVTSVSLSPARKSEIISAMPGVPLVSSDIYGLEDLLNILADHEQIERRHFKLWLGSTVVLERILHSGVYNRTLAEMDIIKAKLPLFVQNDSVGAAEKLLAAAGSLIVAGPPGVGKTTLARMLLWLHAEQGWEIFVVDTPEEALAVAHTDARRLIMLDDFLGQYRLSSDHLRDIDARLPPLFGRVAASPNLRFILTTRDYILAQARALSPKLTPARTDARDYVINVGTYTRSVKARILYNHLYFSALAPEQRSDVVGDDFFLKIIDHKNFNPRIIELVTHAEYLSLTERPIRETIQAVLDNPAELWDVPYRHHIDADGRALMLSMFLSGRAVRLDALKYAFVRVSGALGQPLHAAEIETRFRAAFKELDGSILSLFHGRVIFANPGINDFIQSVIVQDRLLPLLLEIIETPSELRQLWAIFIDEVAALEDRQAFGDAWLDAHGRILAGETGNLLTYLLLAVELYEGLVWSPVAVRIEQILGLLGQVVFAEDHLSIARTLLEKSADELLPGALAARFRTVMTQACANLLTEYALNFSIEDVIALDDDLHEHGNDASLAGRGLSP